jgi:hypothetical protein
MEIFGALAGMLVVIALMVRWAIREDKRRRLAAQMEEVDER